MLCQNESQTESYVTINYRVHVYIYIWVEYETIS